MSPLTQNHWKIECRNFYTCTCISLTWILHKKCIYFHVDIYTYTVHVLIYIFISFFQNPHIRRKEWDGQMCVCMAYPFNRKSYTFDNDTLDLWQRSFKTLNEGTNPLEKRGKHLWIRMLFELWIFGYFKEKLTTSPFYNKFVFTE